MKPIARTTLSGRRLRLVYGRSKTAQPAAMAKESASRSAATEKTPKATSSTELTGTSVIVAYAVQCDKCHKWRKLATEEHFEEFRYTQATDPFVCNKLVGTTCENPADISVDASQVWVMDKPNIPITPKGFKRVVTLRSDYSRTDVQYMTPQGKKIRSGPEMESYLQEHPECSHITPSDFRFDTPKVVRDTVPIHVVKDAASSMRKKRKLKICPVKGRVWV